MATGYTTAPIHKNRTTTLGRVSNFLSDGGLFRNLNLPSKVYPTWEGFNNTGAYKLTYWRLPGDQSGAWKDPQWRDFNNIKSQNFIGNPDGNSWVSFRFGPTWTTHWFKVELDTTQFPAEWVGQEIHLRWNCNCEAAIYNTNGLMLQGLSPGFREEYILSRKWTGNEAPMTFYIECSINGMFGAGNGDMIAPTNNNSTSQLSKADIAPFNRNMYKIITDLDMLKQISEQLSNDHRGYQALYCANEMVNLIKNDQNYEKAGQIADAYFAEGGGQKNHTLVSMGHCHIDTAWLWDYDETIRKVARSWSAQLGLMREYDDYVFACSSAQQYEWLQQYYPDVFQQVKQFVSQGRFLPVGGAWIEMDGNIPSGESFVRQFFYGQRYFKKEFGKVSKEFWLPDTFGYSAQIPQILQHVGITRFLTQKMSWNLVNKFPNHNFWWEGIDGSKVLCHFPPGDSYNMGGSVSELLYSVNNSQDKGRANVGIFLYGQGDGGGGPTRQMIERQNRLKDVDGLPRIVYGSSDYFFEQLEKEQGKLSKWVGELYLELHNGTYTSQATIKWFNRKGEFFLREVELLMAIAVQRGNVSSADYTADQERVDRCWKNLLLNQFHDILPGSCIELAAQTARKVYIETFSTLVSLRTKYNGLLLPAGTATKAVFNPLPWNVRTVIFNKPDTGALPGGANTQQVDLKTTVDDSLEGRFRVPATFTAALVSLNPSGFSAFTPIAPTKPVSFDAATNSFSNGLVRVETAKTGLPYEEIYFTTKSGEQKVFGDRLGTGIRGGMFYVYDDVPLYWDAWDVMDYHLENQKVPNYTAPLPQFERITTGESIVGVSRMKASFGQSTIERYTVVRADSPMVEYYTIVDWHEDHTFLKVEFPVDILSREATYEIQYGHAKRPTHINTSWDMAKFEVCGHKWMDISQADKGVTIITDSKYGWHVRDNIVKLSLLKSPKNPDANCDMSDSVGKHFIYYAVLPHEGTLQEAEVIKRAYELNVFGANNIPILSTSLAGAALPTNWVQTDNPAVIVEAFKVAADDQKACLVRLYESHGGATRNTTISLGFNVTKVVSCDGMETEIAGDPIVVSGNSFKASFKPFQIQSFLVSF